MNANGGGNMLDNLAMISSVLITLIVVAGFVAVGLVLVFEIGSMLYLWLKHAFRGESTPLPASSNPNRRLNP
jgi:hypothetical protein